MEKNHQFKINIDIMFSVTRNDDGKYCLFNFCFMLVNYTCTAENPVNVDTKVSGSLFINT